MSELNSKDDNIFDDTSLSDVFKDIYKNSKDRKRDIDDTMKSFMKYIKQNKDVSFIGPVIKDLLHVSVQNDEQLVKMATIVQRLITNSDDNSNEYGLTPQMKDELLKIAKESNKDITASIPDNFDDLEEVMVEGEVKDIEEIEIEEDIDEEENGK